MLRWLYSMRARRFLCLSVGLAAVMCAACSLLWRMAHDTPVMLYLSGMMVNRGAVPYRDFFDMNLPGSYWVYGLAVKVLGTSDVAAHVANALVVFAVGALLFCACRGPCRLYALFGIGLASLRVFSGQWAFVLQRELVALVPVSALLALGLRGGAPDARKGVAAGLLLAWLALIKPPFLLYGAPPLFLLAAACQGRGGRFRLLAVVGGSFCVPLLLCAAWLVGSGAWPFFLEAVRYWGLYGQMTPDLEFVLPHEKAIRTACGVGKMLVSPYALMAVLGLAVIWRKRLFARNARVAFAAMFLLTVVVPAVSGQFWAYHRLPFNYFSLFLGGFLLSASGALVSCACVLTAVFWICFAGFRTYQVAVATSAVALYSHGVPDRFAAYLAAHADPGDRAQPVDWAYGALHGMLIANVPLATRFPYTFCFLHNVRHPLTQKIRGEFLKSLDEGKPRFLLECTSARRPSGIDTEPRFQAFEDWRDAHYRVAEEGGHYRIWELAPQ